MDRPNSIVYLSMGSRPDEGLRTALTLARVAEAPLTIASATRRPAAQRGGRAAEPWDWESLRRSAGVSLEVVELDGGEQDGRGIEEAVSEWSPLLVVKQVGTAGLARRLTLHRVDRQLMLALPCPVLFLTPRGSRDAGTVLAALALHERRPAELDRAVIRWATTLARWRDAPLHLVHAWSQVGESIITCPTRGMGPVRGRRYLIRTRQAHVARLDELLAAEQLQGEIPRTFGRGSASKVIRNAARHTDADLLVVGHHGRTGLGRVVPGELLDAFVGRTGLSLLAIRDEHACPPARLDASARSA